MVEGIQRCCKSDLSCLPVGELIGPIKSGLSGLSVDEFWLAGWHVGGRMGTRGR